MLFPTNFSFRQFQHWLRLRSVAILSGIALGLAAVAAFAVLSGLTLSRERLNEVVQVAFSRGDLPADPFARANEDFFTECAMLEMQYLRRQNPLWNAIDTRFLMAPNVHPCGSLQVMAAGSATERSALPEPVSYFSYPYGSRHLESAVLSLLDYRQATQLYSVLSYAALVVLFGAMLRNNVALGLWLAPFPLALIAGFALHVHGHYLAHAPGYIAGVLLLAVFVGAPVRMRDLRWRLAFAAALGVVAAYFDLLNRVIPTLLALTIVLNHFFYPPPAESPSRYLARALGDMVTIFLAFVLAYVALTLIRLGLLATTGVDTSPFVHGLASRTSNELGSGHGLATFWRVAKVLWSSRFQLVPGGVEAANWLILGALAGWLFSALACPLVMRGDRRVAIFALVDALILVAAALGIAAWYARFSAHSYIHTLFMVRLIALPAALGFVVAALTVRASVRAAVPAHKLVPIAVVSLLAAALLLHDPWGSEASVRAPTARFIAATADRVSCAALGMRPDGIPDGVIEISYERTVPPLARLGVSAPETRTQMILSRTNPPGAHETGPVNHILGVADRPNGPLINQTNGGIATRSGRRKLYAHICYDGHETEQSVYELRIDKSAIPVSR